MIKNIIAICLSILFLTSDCAISDMAGVSYYGASGGGVPSGLPACTTSGDSSLAEQTTANDSYNPGLTTFFAQSFVLSDASRLTGWNITISNIGGAGYYTASIYTNNAGVPGTEVADTTVSVPLASIGYRVSVWFELAAVKSLTAGTYHLVSRGTGTNPSLEWRRNTDGGYSGGNITYSTDSGSSWSSVAGQDFTFQVMGCTP